MKVEIFLIKDEYELIHPRSVSSNGLVYIAEGEVQLSDPTEIEFETFSEKEITLNKINALDRLISSERSQFQSKINSLELQRQELLAIECD